MKIITLACPMGAEPDDADAPEGEEPGETLAPKGFHRVSAPKKW